ncbi:MAG: response regulator transcription factor [Bacteroidales bacterium]|nr:response regulator transcription factor [Bacteroidales bacterium]
MYQPSHLIIADTQVLIVEGLKVLLNKVFGTISQVTSMAELKQLLQYNPDSLLIIDNASPDLGGLENLIALRKAYPAAGIIVLSNHFNQAVIVELSHAGISHVLHKSADEEELTACIEAVKRGRRYYASYVLDIMMGKESNRGVSREGATLTHAETEIVRLIAEGLTNKQIAQRKTLSIHTIMTHRKNILRKLGVSSASELVMTAIRRGWVDVIDYQI